MPNVDGSMCVLEEYNNGFHIDSALLHRASQVKPDVNSPLGIGYGLCLTDNLRVSNAFVTVVPAACIDRRLVADYGQS